METAHCHTIRCDESLTQQQFEWVGIKRGTRMTEWRNGTERRNGMAERNGDKTRNGMAERNGGKTRNGKGERNGDKTRNRMGIKRGTEWG